MSERDAKVVRVIFVVIGITFILCGIFPFAWPAPLGETLKKDNLVMLFGVATATLARIAFGVACLLLGVALIRNGLTGKEGEFRYGEEGQDGPMPVRAGRVLYTSVGIMLSIGGLLCMVV